MVHHVIGRKHRQKYVELKRPDLVTWDKQSIITQGGKIIRARAEIIERQDGRGKPVPMLKRGVEGKLNISRVHPRQKQNRDRNLTRDVPSHVMEVKDYQDEYSHRQRSSPVYPNTPQFHPDEPYMNRNRQMYQPEDSLSRDHMEKELCRANYRENDMYRRRDYEEEYVENPQARTTLEPGSITRYDPREEMPMRRDQTLRVEYYPEEAPLHRRPYPERDPLKEFYCEEVRRGRVHSAEYKPSQPAYPEDEDQWSLDRKSGRHDSVNRASRPGSSEPEAKRRSFPTPTENEQSHDHLFNIIRNCQHKMRELHQEITVSNPGPSRTGPPPSQRRVEVTRTLSGIPEPFRCFLTGAANDQGHSKRKRKSRFSDATDEEVDMIKEIFEDKHVPPDPKFGGCPRPVSVPLRPEIHRTQHPTESQSPHHTESYQRGGSVSEGVFDMLKNIEIENAEEADFLKNKLCSLLKEFKSKKSEKTVQNNQSRGVLNNSDFNSLRPVPQLSPQHHYERTLLGDSDLRPPQDFSFKDDHRRQDWKQYEYIPDERLQKYHHPVRSESGHMNRRRYEDCEETFRSSKMSSTSHANRDEPVHYPERFQQPMHPCDYRPAAEEYFGSHSSSPPLHMEQEIRMHRGSRYSKNLDKITSILELVARK
ncbi:uncharacterized protein si:ch211-13c6.2 isoform X2 [Toxotes jaculatrix]|nr:uncharacterized protein si:ch211-13c6.2 isoform X2 [Toxotes jaculatrix]